MSRVNSFFKGVSKEFRKITWPTEKEMKEYIIQVFIFVILLAVFFFAVDFVINQALNFLR